jgi:hypothetical protein
METKLHHFAYNITPGNLEFVVELFEKLGCELTYRKEKARWCMIRQKSIPVDIQIIETKDKPIQTKIKINTHIAFLSETPEEDIQNIKKWAENKNKKVIKGAWSKKEYWFDIPDTFINFVIEIMHNSVIS